MACLKTESLNDFCSDFGHKFASENSTFHSDFGVFRSFEEIYNRMMGTCSKPERVRISDIDCILFASNL